MEIFKKKKKTTSKYHQFFYVWLRWKSWRVNVSLHWRDKKLMKDKTSDLCGVMRRHNISQITWNKQKCHISIMFSTLFLFIWALTGALLITPFRYVLFFCTGFMALTRELTSLSWCTNSYYSYNSSEWKCTCICIFFWQFSGNSVKICTPFEWKWKRKIYKCVFKLNAQIYIDQCIPGVK